MTDTPNDFTPEEQAAAAQRSLRRVTKGGPQRTRKVKDRTGRDPELLGSALEKLVVEQGWQHDSAVAALTTKWSEIVGPDVAAHSTPGSSVVASCIFRPNQRHGPPNSSY